MIKVKIRKAEKKDLRKIAEILRAEYTKPPYNEKWTKKDALEKIKAYFKKRVIFIAKIEKEIIGFIVIETFFYHDENIGWVDDIVISKKFQGKGAGKKLMKYFENYLIKKKVDSVWLLVHKKAEAINFYKKLGYKETGYISFKKKIK